MNQYEVGAILRVKARSEQDAVDTVHGAIDRASHLDDGTGLVDGVAYRPIPGAKVIVFQWNTDHGECYECGRPAAFMVVDAAAPRQYDPSYPYNLRCALCAANNAADGETIRRIREEA